MRIAVVTDQPDDDLIGLAGALTDIGHRLTIYTRRADPDVPANRTVGHGVTVRAIPAGPAEPLLPDELRDHIGTFGAGLAKAWHQEPPALIHTGHWMAALAALVAARQLPVPLVRAFAPGSITDCLGANGHGATDTANTEQVRLERAICREADHLIVGCGEDRDELTTSGLSPGKVTVVPTAVDLERFSPHGPAYPRTGHPRLVSIGPSGPNGGADTAVRALRLLPDAELVIAGDLHQMSGKASKSGNPGERSEAAGQPDRDRLQALARHCEVDERIRVLDQVNTGTLPALIRSADAVLCVPARRADGAPELAAMACGKPVIATAVGSLKDSVVDGVTGWFVRPSAPDELARTVRRLLSEETWLQGFGMSARERAVARFSWPRIAVETARVYDSLGPTGS